jgi:thiamine biosynthesis lipoprotein
MMGMPITIEIADAWASPAAFELAFDYFDYVDQTFSTYKSGSEISQINDRRRSLDQASPDMRAVLRLAEETRRETFGYFDIARGGRLDPSGIVKGWAIYRAAELLRENGFRNFYVDAGGDIQACGLNAKGQPWRVGIRSPFNHDEIVKVVAVSDLGVATSGTYARGQHIYNPLGAGLAEIVSLTVIGPNIYEADRFATAAFAMGRDGIAFIEWMQGFEGYLIDANGIATLTSGLERYVCHDEAA